MHCPLPPTERHWAGVEGWWHCVHPQETGRRLVQGNAAAHREDRTFPRKLCEELLISAVVDWFRWLSSVPTDHCPHSRKFCRSSSMRFLASDYVNVCVWLCETRQQLNSPKCRELRVQVADYTWSTSPQLRCVGWRCQTSETSAACWICQLCESQATDNALNANFSTITTSCFVCRRCSCIEWLREIMLTPYRFPIPVIIPVSSSHPQSHPQSPTRTTTSWNPSLCMCAENISVCNVPTNGGNNTL